MLKDVLVKRSKMSDDADKTQERLELEEMLRRKYASEEVHTQGNGQCLNCGDKITKERRWCSKECADDWEYYNKHKQ